MKKTTITFLQVISILFATSVFAQKQISTDVSEYKLTENTIAYANYTLKEKQLIISFLDSIRLNVLVLDNQLQKTTDSIAYLLPSEGYTIQNSIINKASLNYLLEKQNGYLSLLQFNRKDKKWTMGTNLLRDGENFLCTFPYQNKLYVFNYERNTKLIKVYTADVNGPILYADFDLSAFKIGENDIAHFLKRKKKALKVITTESPNELFSSIKSKKAYQFDEKIFFSIEDSITNSVGVIQFDLKTKKQATDYYTNNVKKCTENQFVKSAISQNYIVTVIGCANSADITIWDNKSNKVVQKSTIYQDSIIQFKNYDNLISPKQALSIEKLKATVLLRKLVTENTAVYLDENESNLDVLLGYSKVKKKKMKQKKGGGKGNGGGKGTGGGQQRKIAKENKRKVKGTGISKSYLNFEAARPQYLVASYGLKEKRSDTSIVYKNSFESIKQFKNKLNQTMLGAQIVFKINGLFWFGYYDKSTKKMELIQVD